MSPYWLANADPATAWAHQAWSGIDARMDKETTTVILPVHGFADHGMGLPLDAEELVGSAVLRSAVEAAGGVLPLLVLPPLRLVAAPYPHTRFGVDTETALAALMEIAAGVKAAGFSKVAFFNTSPWNAEIVSIAALDCRTRLGLLTYVVSSAGLGLGFHPADPGRKATQAAAVHLAGRPPQEERMPAAVHDADFRPGCFGQPEPVAFDPSLSGAAILRSAAGLLVEALIEISAHPSAAPADIAAPAALPPPCGSAAQARDARSLSGLTGIELVRLPDKERALVIIPAGAIEQHGHHLPVGTDAMLGRLWLSHALPRLPENAPVFVAPPLTYGKSNEHEGFAGTLSLSVHTFRRQLLALAAELMAAGFRRIAVLNTHGGNSPAIVATLREIQAAPGARAGMLAGYYKPRQSAQESAYGFHAGEWETSLMLAGAPELVHMDRAVCEYPALLDRPGVLRPVASAAVAAWKTSDLSRSGVMGDATIATADKGRLWLDEASAALAARIMALLAA